MSGDYNCDNHRRNQQVKERQEGFYFRNLLRQLQEGIQRKKRRWSWIKPWLYACASIRAYPSSERSAILHHYIPLEKLPRALVADTASNEASESSLVIIRSLST